MQQRYVTNINQKGLRCRELQHIGPSNVVNVQFAISPCTTFSSSTKPQCKQCIIMPLQRADIFIPVASVHSMHILHECIHHKQKVLPIGHVTGLNMGEQVGNEDLKVTIIFQYSMSSTSLCLSEEDQDTSWSQ